MFTDLGYTTNNVYEFTSEDWARALVEDLSNRENCIEDGYLLLHTSDAPETYDLVSLICRNNFYTNRLEFVSMKVHEVCPEIKGVKVVKDGGY